MGDRSLVLRDADGGEHRASVAADGSVTVEGQTFSPSVAADGSLHLAGAPGGQAWALVSDDVRWVFLDGRVYTFEVEGRARVRRRSAAHAGALAAPMPATVRKIAVAAGDPVARGDVLIVLEAMKMELPIRAVADGTVKGVHCREGEMVQPGQELVEFD